MDQVLSLFLELRCPIHFLRDFNNAQPNFLYGYSYLYKNNLVHKDLKPANILVLDEKYKIRVLTLLNC